MAKNGVTTITVRGNVTEAIGALDSLGIKAEETAAKTDAAFNGKHGGTGLANFGKIVSVGLAGIGVASVHMAGDFQQSMTQLVTGAGESESAIGKVSKGILALAPQVGTTTKQLAAGMYLIESAGFRGADALNVLKASAEGAKVGNADLGSVANAVTSVLNLYHLKAGDAATVTSQLVATTAAGKMHMQDLADSLAAVLPISAKAGLSFGQVGGALATMTVTGMSAQQASQDLAFTIRNLQAPSNVAANEMAQFGINANDVQQNLGKRGLTGTLQMLTEAITEHMGPAGQVLLNTFNQSMGASADLRIELGKMSPELRKLAEEYINGTITGKDFRSATRELPANQAALAAGFVSTYQSAHKWNDLLKSGRPDVTTFNAALEKMTGGATGLNTSLMLTGGSTATFTGNVKSVSSATADAKGNVKGWTDVQKDFNFKMDEAKARLEVMGIKIGTVLIPWVEKMVGWMQTAVTWLGKHKTAAEVLAGVITTVLGAAMALFVFDKIAKFVKGIQGAITTLGNLTSKSKDTATNIGKDAQSMGNSALGKGSFSDKFTGGLAVISAGVTAFQGTTALLKSNFLGIGDAVNSVTKAISNFFGGIGQVKPSAVMGSGTIQWLEQVAAGQVKSYDTTPAQAVAALHQAGIPGYERGTRYVPRTGLALLHAGESVLTAKETQQRNRSQGRGDIVNNFYITSQADARQIANETTWALGRLIT